MLEPNKAQNWYEKLPKTLFLKPEACSLTPSLSPKPVVAEPPLYSIVSSSLTLSPDNRLLEKHLP